MNTPDFAKLVRAHKRKMMLWVSLAMAVLLIDWITPLGVNEAMLYAIVVLLSASANERRLTVALASLATILIGVGFVISPPGASLWVAITNRCLTILLVWLAAAVMVRRIRAERERDAALRNHESAQAHISLLHGLLPICAWCKQIREENGRWVKLESYISQHSGASFTHSICPDCKERVLKKRGDQP